MVFLILSPIEPPSVSHAIPTSLESIENLAQEIYDEHLAQISQENKQPSNGFKFVHSHTPKEELLSPHSGQPLKSYSYQYIGKRDSPFYSIIKSRDHWVWRNILNILKR